MKQAEWASLSPGFFTLADAFRSREIAQRSDAEVAASLGGYRADPDAWKGGAVERQTDLTRRLAREWLGQQPASTIKAQARAVVAANGPDAYLSAIRSIMESDLPVHPIAGARSAAG